METATDLRKKDYVEMIISSIRSVPRRNIGLSLPLEPHQYIILNSFVSRTGKQRLQAMLESGCSLESVIINDYFNAKGLNLDSTDTKEMLEELYQSSDIFRTITGIKAKQNKNRVLNNYHIGPLLLVAESYLSLISNRALELLKYSGTKQDLKSIIVIEQLFGDYAIPENIKKRNPSVMLRSLLADHYINRKSHELDLITRDTARITSKTTWNKYEHHRLQSLEKKLDAIQIGLQEISGIASQDANGIIHNIFQNIKENKSAVADRKRKIKSTITSMLNTAAARVTKSDYSNRSMKELQHIRHVTTGLVPVFRNSSLETELKRVTRMASDKIGMFKEYDASIAKLRQYKTDISYYSEKIDSLKPKQIIKEIAILNAYKQKLDDIENNLAFLTLPKKQQKDADRLKQQISVANDRISHKAREVMRFAENKYNYICSTPYRHSYFSCLLFKNRILTKLDSMLKHVQTYKTSYNQLQQL